MCVCVYVDGDVEVIVMVQCDAGEGGLIFLSQQQLHKGVGDLVTFSSLSGPVCVCVCLYVGGCGDACISTSEGQVVKCRVK